MFYLLVVLFIIGVVAIGVLLRDDEQTTEQARDLWQEAQEREQ